MLSLKECNIFRNIWWSQHNMLQLIEINACSLKFQAISNYKYTKKNNTVDWTTFIGLQKEDIKSNSCLKLGNADCFLCSLKIL